MICVIVSFETKISCGVGDHLLAVCVSRSKLSISRAVVFIATDLGTPAPDAHTLINSYNKSGSLEKRNSDLQISLPLLTKVSSSPNSPFNCF